MTLRSHTSGADEARGRRSPIHRLWLWLIALIACDLGLVTLRATTYPALFLMPGALGYLMEPVAALIIYAIGIGVLPFLVARAPEASVSLRVGTIAGLVGGAIEVVSTALESLWALPQHVVSLTTGAAMFLLFLSFGVAGFIGGRCTNSFRCGLIAAVWSAVVAILIVVTFGFLLVNSALPQLAHDEIGDPDFLRSGWADIRAFAIANTYDAGFTHLAEAPVIATLLGAVGSGAVRIAYRCEKRKLGMAGETQK